MKSPKIQSAAYISVEDKARYSDMLILESPAGYYIGTLYSNSEGFKEPGSRDSAYFDERGDAEKLLQTVKNVVNPQEYLRDNP